MFIYTYICIHINVYVYVYEMYPGPQVARPSWLAAASEISEEERAKLRQDHLKLRYLELKVCSLEEAKFELKFFLRCFVG